MHTTYTGLTEQEVEQSIKQHGENKIPEKKNDPLIILFLKQFHSPLVYVLLCVAVVTLFLKEYSDSIIILIVVVINSIIATFQGRKANNVIASLRTLSRSKSKVIRNNEIVELVINKVVMGDYVVLSAGDIVPADGLLVEHSNLQINESKINGESMPVAKSDIQNEVYRSTVVISGSGVYVVHAIGTETVIGKVSTDILENVNNDTILEQKIRQLVRVILVVVLISSIILIIIGMIRNIELFVLFKTAISLAVSAIPEGLPIVVTVVLAVGAWRISKVQGLLKNLPSGATLATVSFICTDKTGTLTKGDITIKEIINLGVHTDDTVLYEYIAHSVDIKRIGKTIVGDALDLKMYDFFNEKGGKPLEQEERTGTLWQETKELPFTSENKFNAKEYLVDAKHIQIYKGAPELLIGKTELLEKLTVQGYRVLAIGYKEVPANTDFSTKDVVPLALIVFEDPVRTDVIDAITDCKNAGLSVMMITGDNIHTATHVARITGIIQDTEKHKNTTASLDDIILEGKIIQSYSDDELSAILPRLKVVARANPLDKLRIVKLLQKQGHIVAMTGDGVNDGPAIALADIGIAMGRTGTEVAKEAADFILVEDSFSNIRDGIFEARTIIENIRKTLIFLLSTSVGEILIILISVFAGLPIPLLPVQILWINLITDGFLNIAIAQEKAEATFKNFNYKRYQGGLLKKKDFIRMSLMAVTMTLVSLAVFVTVLKFFVLPVARTMMLVSVTVIQWLNAFNVRKHMLSIFSHNIFSNVYILIALVFEVILLLLSMYTPIGNKILQTQVIEPRMILIMLAVATPIIFVDEIYKYFARKQG